MIVTIRKRSQITLPSEIVIKLGLYEGDQLDVMEQDGTIMLFPMTAYWKYSRRILVIRR